MQLFSVLDLIALAWFLLAWIGYSLLVDWSHYGARGLTTQMHCYRDIWMQRMLDREMRMIDTQIIGTLQNGNAFFASTSLIAAGGTLTLLRSSDEIIKVVETLPFGVETSRLQWEAKTIGLVVIFVYAFFKFAWSYRLFNYVAILIGSTPPASEKDEAAAKAHAARAARLCEVAARHFNRGQRAFFFALGYLGWYLGPAVLAATTAAVVFVTWRRQFASESRLAVLND